MTEARENAERATTEYWRGFEAELGEPIIAKTMGQRFESPKDRGSWGLLVLTPTRLIYRKMPSESWVASLFRAPSSPGMAEKVEDSAIALESVTKVLEPGKTLMDRIFGSPFSVFTVARDGRDDGPRFAVDPKAGLLAALRAALAELGR